MRRGATFTPDQDLVIQNVAGPARLTNQYGAVWVAEVSASDFWTRTLPMRVCLVNRNRLGGRATWARIARARNYEEAAEIIEVWSLLAVCWHVLSDRPYAIANRVRADRTGRLRTFVERLSRILSLGDRWQVVTRRSPAATWIQQLREYLREYAAFAGRRRRNVPT